MKFVLLVIALAVSSSFALEDVYQAEWKSFKNRHGKSYLSSAEELVRFTIFRSNLNFINKHNEEAKSGMHSFFLKMNEYGDMTNKEFVAKLNGYNATLKAMSSLKPVSVFEYNPNVQVPDSIDWRQQGYVTPVKNQVFILLFLFNKIELIY